jgi:Transglutaminase-like superfamily
VKSIVLQAWEAAHGRRRDLVVGVTDSAGFRAHAWLEGDPVHADAGLDPSGLGLRERAEAVEAGGDHGAPPQRQFHELLRRPAPPSGRSRESESRPR